MTNKRGYLIVGFFLLIYIIYVSSKAIVDHYRVDENGVYVIGSLTEVDRGGKNGATKSYAYFYHQKKYNFSIRDSWLNDSLIYLRILPTNPNVSRFVKQKVPDCIKLKDVPIDGWQTLPNSACN